NGSEQIVTKQTSLKIRYRFPGMIGNNSVAFHGILERREAVRNYCDSSQWLNKGSNYYALPR
ncbi:MAG TPA: hypothetical protein VHW43_03205, partial [Puia sp.]|nr:hypothetical protein [Puia sp.]